MLTIGNLPTRLEILKLRRDTNPASSGQTKKLSSNAPVMIFITEPSKKLLLMPTSEKRMRLGERLKLKKF
jgi:hypothetical protein